MQEGQLLILIIELSPAARPMLSIYTVIAAFMPATVWLLKIAFEVYISPDSSTYKTQ